MDIELERLVVSLVGEVDSLKMDIGDVTEQLYQFEQVAESVASSAESSFRMMAMQMGTAMQQVGGLISNAGRGMRDMSMGFIQQGIASAGAFEQTEIAFTTFLGSAEATKQTLADLTDFAAKTPFEMPEIEQAAKGLITFGDRGPKLMETLKYLGDAASATSTNFGDVASIFNQIRGVTKLTREDFKQLATRGVISLQDIADHYKVTTAEADNMMSKGKVSFDDFSQIMKGLSQEGGRFANMMEKQSSSFVGLTSTMNDAFNITIREIGTYFLPYAKMAVGFVIQLLEVFRSLPTGVIAGIAAFLGFGAVLGTILIAVGGVISFIGVAIAGFAALGPLVMGAAAAFMSFAPLAIPLAAVAAGITAIVAAAAGLVALVFWPEQIGAAFARLGDYIVMWIPAMIQNFVVISTTITELFGLTVGFLSKKFYIFFTEDLPTFAAKGIQKIIALFQRLSKEMVRLLATGKVSTSFSKALADGFRTGASTDDFGKEFARILKEGADDLSMPGFGKEAAADAKEMIAEVHQAAAAAAVDPKMLEKGKELTKSLRTPYEKLIDEYKEYEGLLGSGVIDMETYNRAVKAAQKSYGDAEKAAKGHRDEVEANFSSMRAFAPSVVGLQKDLAALRLSRGITDPKTAIAQAMPKPTLSVENANKLASSNMAQYEPIITKLQGIIDAVKGTTKKPTTDPIATSEPTDTIPAV